ncbi:unnamed protein product [Moneuplotes crassus]|uniref:Glutathione transferase n=1 Tax=Euplotes crassus TaxID=5936 RepID=A0AAD2D406_EUPCR|nr:unnamed protein product [Moneuplotes crassus]
MSKYTLHGNIISQPTRAVIWTLRTLGLDFEYKHTEFVSGTRSQKYTSKVNTFAQVPALVFGDEVLTQSNTVIRYLANEHDKDSELLPRDDYLDRAKVEELLDIAATNVRFPLLKAIGAIVAGPLLFGTDKVSEEEELKLMGEVNTVLDKLNTKLGDNTYFTGDKLTVGDVHIFTELETTVFFLKLDLSGHPQLKAWYGRVGSNEILAEIGKEMVETLTAIQESQNSASS